MTNQNDRTNDSLFTEIELDEATNVNGGSWSPSDFNFSYGGYSTSVGYYGFLNNYNRYGSSYHLPSGYTFYNSYGF